MITCALRAHVKHTMNRKNNPMCENPYPIKCVLELFSYYKCVVNLCP